MPVLKRDINAPLQTTVLAKGERFRILVTLGWYGPAVSPEDRRDASLGQRLDAVSLIDERGHQPCAGVGYGEEPLPVRIENETGISAEIGRIRREPDPAEIFEFAELPPLRVLCIEG
jgi:hypothetical protein